MQLIASRNCIFFILWESRSWQLNCWLPIKVAQFSRTCNLAQKTYSRGSWHFSIQNVYVVNLDNAFACICIESYVRCCLASRLSNVQTWIDISMWRVVTSRWAERLVYSRISIFPSIHQVLCSCRSCDSTVICWRATNIRHRANSPFTSRSHVNHHHGYEHHLTTLADRLVPLAQPTVITSSTPTPFDPFHRIIHPMHFLNSNFHIYRKENSITCVFTDFKRKSLSSNVL